MGPVTGELFGALPPPMVLGATFALFYAFLFKGLAGRRSEGLPLCVLASLLGFVAGQLLGGYLATTSPRVGELHVVEGTIGSWVVLLLANRPHL